jgi:hypothetical protein
MKTALSAVKMETLAMDVHMVWMKEMSGLMTADYCCNARH